jgi:hypothetical protein
MEFPKPKGDPIAATSADLPSFTVGRLFASIFSTAMSVCLSLPMTFALNSRRSVRRTVTVSALSTTCALVRM